MDVSRETLEKLEVYEALVKKWTASVNLIAPSTVSDLWDRHIVDSQQLFSLIPEESKTLVDLGSGAGFPGVVLAIMLQEIHPHARVTLIEADKRKCVFLRTVSRETQTPFDVVADRIEVVDAQAADVVTARALAALPRLLIWADQHMKPGGKALFLKGASALKEIAAAKADWSFRCNEHPSKTDANGKILDIGELRRAG